LSGWPLAWFYSSEVGIVRRSMRHSQRNDQGTTKWKSALKATLFIFFSALSYFPSFFT
jgi:hypothetical protein